MGRSLIVDVLLLTTALIGARYAVAGSGAVRRFRSRHSYYPSRSRLLRRTVLEHCLPHRSRRQQAILLMVLNTT
jgi:hypothetical protein